MQSSNLNKTIKNDINLLVTLYFLLKHKKVSAVANEMFIGQSAVSHQLNKLRAIFDNELLVRTAKGMRLTPFAEQIYPEVEGVLAELESLFTRHEEVSPQLTPRKPVYRVCMPDNVYINDIASLLVRFVEQEKLSDKVIFEVFERYDQCVTDLNDGKIDFFFGQIDNLSRQVRSSPLVNLEYFLAVRPGHTLAGQTATVRTLADYPLVEVIFQHKIAVLAREVYGEVTNRMKTILKTSSTNTAIHLIKESDAITLLPLTTIKKMGLARVIIRGKRLTMMNYLYWHQIMNNDPFHSYVREHLLRKYVEDKIITEQRM